MKPRVALPCAAVLVALALQTACAGPNREEKREARREAREQAEAPPPSTTAAPASQVKGGLYVSGTRLMSDGQPFNLRGVQILAFVAPKAQADRSIQEARANWGQSQLDSIKAFGANTIRFQMSQAGLDPRSSIYSPAYAEDLFKTGVALALANGFRVILSMQWEENSGAPVQQRLPGENTVALWKQIAEQYRGDDRVMFELYNEPGALPTEENWQIWLKGGKFADNPDGKAVGMQTLINTIRATGARNVLILPGLKLEKILRGAPIPHDPLNNFGWGFHTPDLSDPTDTWESQFGFMANRYPVILTEWVAGAGHHDCNEGVPDGVRRFLNYAKSKNFGVSANAWDARGALREDDGSLTSLVGFRCRTGHDKGMDKQLQKGIAGKSTSADNGPTVEGKGGPGKIISNFYKSGVVAE